MSSQAWQIRRREGNAPSYSDLLLATDLPIPQTDSHIVVQIHAAALNYRDVMIIDQPHTYPSNTKHGLTPGSDGAGTVISAPAPSQWKAGDQVIFIPNTGWLQGADQKDFQLTTILGGDDCDGTLRQYAIVKDDSHLIAKPANLSFEEAASIPTAGATAANSLFHGSVTIRPGTVVVTQGTGGVSLFAIQLASAAGATVIALSSSDEKLKIAKQAGASHLINYNTHPEWDVEVLKLTGQKGADLVVDVGGASTFKKSLGAVKLGGEVALAGLLGGGDATVNELVPAILFKGAKVRGILGFSRAMVQEAVEILAEKSIKPVISKVWDWEGVKDALEEVGKAQSVGKVVVRIK